MTLDSFQRERLLSFAPRRIGRSRAEPFVSAIDQYGLAQAEAEFSRFERSLGFSLPEDYREFAGLLGHSSFKERICIHPIEPDLPDSTFVVSVIFGPITSERYALANEMRHYTHQLPSNIVPIATDPGGDLLTISAAGPDMGHIYYWDHEHRALGHAKLTSMRADLERRGVSGRTLDSADVIRIWEEAQSSELPHRIGYGSLYLVATGIGELIERFAPLEQQSKVRR